MRTLALLFFGLLSVLSALAPPAAEARQVALVIGNARYTAVQPLKNPKRDAAAIADRLRDLQFEVQEVFDGDSFSLARAAERFLADARGADLALFYFAGHGIQLFDRNVLLASDADPRTVDRLDALGLDLTGFLARLRTAGPVRSAVLIDACRDNPLSFDETVALLRRVAPEAGRDPGQAARSIAQRGLARTDLKDSASGAGQTLMFFAAQPGDVSYDGDGQNSFFVEGLKQALSQSDRPLSQVFQQASAYVRTVTSGRQVPQVVSDWTGDIVLGRAETAKVRYLNVFGANGRKLSEAEIQRIGEANRTYPAFVGSFIVRENHTFSNSWFQDEEAAKSAKDIGSVNGFAIDYDLDRDGTPESLSAYFRQTFVIFSVVKEGIPILTAPCYEPDKEEVETVEIALRDINGDRKPEIFLHMKTANDAWGRFCILEFNGVRDLADARRGPGGTRYDYDGKLFRVLLRQTTASVRIGEDNTIETCDGSNCHTRSVIRFDGTRFRLTVDESMEPSRARAQPFRDEAERARIGAVTATLTAPEPTRQDDSGRGIGRVPTGAATSTAETAIGDYVQGVYLRDGANGTLNTRFAETVLYYGKSTQRAEILADKRKYYARWVTRSYTLIPGTLTIGPPAADGSRSVVFEYDFALRRAGPQATISQGRGRSRLTLKPDSGGFVILAEDGEVLARK